MKSMLSRKRPLLDIYNRRTSLQKELREVGLVRQGERYLQCGFGDVLFDCNNSDCEDFGAHTMKKFRCDLRICPTCSEINAKRLKEKYAPHINKCKKARSIYDYGLRFLTLTISNQEDIGEGITMLYQSITRLRRRKYFKERVNAGLGVIEMKVGFDNKWNIHVHLIIESTFLDMKSHKYGKKKATFVKEWAKASRDVGVCDVRLLNQKRYKYSKNGALDYTLDYLSKGQSHMNNIEKAVFLRFSKGRRIVFSFGKFYSISNPKYDLLCNKCFGKLTYISTLWHDFGDPNKLDFYEEIT